MTSTDPTPATAPVLTITWDSVIGTEQLGYNPETGEVDEIPLTLGASVADIIARRLIDGMRSDVRTAVLQAVTDTIQAEVLNIVREQLATPLRKTNRWGEPEGQTQTLRELLAEDVKSYLTEKVPDRHSYNDVRRGGFRELLKHEVDDALTKDLRDVITEARKQVVGQVQKKAAALIAEAIK